MRGVVVESVLTLLIGRAQLADVHQTGVVRSQWTNVGAQHEVVET